MSKKKRGLGRGLDALMAGAKVSADVATVQPEDTASAEPVAAADVLNDGDLRRVPIEWIQPGQYQPRKDIQPEALEELAASIKA